MIQKNKRKEMFARINKFLKIQECNNEHKGGANILLN